MERIWRIMRKSIENCVLETDDFLHFIFLIEYLSKTFANGRTHLEAYQNWISSIDPSPMMHSSYCPSIVAVVVAIDS